MALKTPNQKEEPMTIKNARFARSILALVVALLTTVALSTRAEAGNTNPACDGATGGATCTCAQLSCDNFCAGGTIGCCAVMPPTQMGPSGRGDTGPTGLGHCGCWIGQPGEAGSICAP
jgi:hypothetical protein